MLRNEPQPLDQNHWRSRWLVDGDWKMLHRVSKDFLWGNPEEPRPHPSEREDDDQKIEGVGFAICGHSGFMCMPGIFSRMSLQRCPECCKLLNIPEGKGNAYNEGLGTVEK